MPQIRKTGGYIPVQQGESDEETIRHAEEILRATLKEKENLLKKQRLQIEQQKKLIGEQDTEIRRLNGVVDEQVVHIAKSGDNIIQLENQVGNLLPKALYSDNVLDSVSCFTTTQIAKELGITAQELNRSLCALHIQYYQSGQYLLYADYAHMGLAKSRTRYSAFLDPKRNEAAKRTDKYKDVPLIVAPGQEDEYLEVKARLDAEAEKEKKAEPQETPDSSTEEATPSVVQQEETALQTNENGWDGLLQSFGLNGFSDIGKNLGYVLAMLPDVLVGLFTGKTKSLNMDNSLLPLASIVAGMFVKNPILKMLLMGMGGANLLNKAGHEVLGRKQQEGIAPTVSPAASRIQYRQYPDEPLNPRISNPMLQGRCLVANIDHVPCTIQLPDSVIGAHQSGALPLNTLANAILAKNDQMRQMAAMQYEEQARESVVRPRGIQ